MVVGGLSVYYGLANGAAVELRAAAAR